MTNSFVWEGHPEAPKEGVEKRMPHLQFQLIQFCIGGHSTLPDELVHKRPVWGDDVDAEGTMDNNGEEVVDPMLTDRTLHPSALVYINLVPEPMQAYVQSPDYKRNRKTVRGYEALVVKSDLPHGMMTVPAPAAGEARPLRIVLMGRLRSVFQSKERSQMTHEAPIHMNETCVYNPTHIAPWFGPEDASRNIGNKMMSVFATLEGGGFSNCAFASEHALNLICYPENIRMPPARLDNRPIVSSASAVAAETVKKEFVINDSDDESSDSDSDQKPAAKFLKKRSVRRAQAATNDKPTPRKKPAKVLSVNESDSFVSVGSEKSSEVSSDSDLDVKVAAKQKQLSVFENSRNKRGFRQQNNEAKRKKMLVDDNTNYRGRKMSQMSASDSIVGKSLNFSAEEPIAVDTESRTDVNRSVGRSALPTRKAALVAKASETTKNEIKARASKRLEKNTTVPWSAKVVVAKPRPKAQTTSIPTREKEAMSAMTKWKSPRRQKQLLLTNHQRERKHRPWSTHPLQA